MKEALAHLEKVDRELDTIGDAVAFVIEMTDELEELKRRCESIRRQAEAAGVVLRYDRPIAANDDSPHDDDPDSGEDDEN